MYEMAIANKWVKIKKAKQSETWDLGSVGFGTVTRSFQFKDQY